MATQSTEVLTSRTNVNDSDSLPRLTKKRGLIIGAVAISIVAVLTVGGILIFKSSGTLQSDIVGSYRLPDNIVPLSYDLWLQPFVNSDYKVLGNETILLDVRNETDKIFIHMRNITVKLEDVSVVNNNGNVKLNVKKIVTDELRHLLIIQLGRPMDRGNHTLQLKFEGVLSYSYKVMGFYRAKYMRDGKEVRMAATQFQAVEARMAFPCFDEPHLKAMFTIHLARQTNMTTLSNMNMESTVPISHDWVWDNYHTSPLMPTYLVAFLVSDFVHIKPPPGSSRTPFRVWFRKEMIDQGRYANIDGPLFQEYFEKYYELEYPLPKQDMVAVPEFLAGGMENYGLIKYRESKFAYRQDAHGTAQQEIISALIGHEIAHQWFGNLVTLKWWDHMWLNEGFASYTATLVLSKLKPQWEALDGQGALILQGVMEVDGRVNTRAMVHSVQTRDEIESLFDKISYDRGESINRMMSGFLTEETFRKGLVKYLKKHQFGNTVTDDLWAALTEQAHIDKRIDRSITMKMIMDSWSLQPGYPVINVNRNYSTRTATITQRRFVISGPLTNQIWWVPLTYRMEGSRDVKFMWFNQSGGSIQQMPPSHDWVLCNVNLQGYYRVNYDEQNWKMLIRTLMTNHNQISPSNRAQLLDDSFALARAGQLNQTVALELSQYLVNERHQVPWHAGLKQLKFLQNMLKDTELERSFNIQMKALLGGVFRHFGFEVKSRDSHLDKLLRISIVQKACELGMEECISDAKIQFNRWMAEQNPDTKNPIHPDTRATVYCTAIKHGGAKELDFARERLAKTRFDVEKDRILKAMSCSNATSTMRYLSNLLIHSDKQDIDFVESIFKEQGDEVNLFDLLNSKWDIIGNIYTTASLRDCNRVVDLFEVVTDQMKTTEDLEKFLTFWEKNRRQLINQERSMKMMVEKIENNIQWMRNNFPLIQQYYIDRK